MKQFRVVFKDSDRVVVVNAHHFKPDNLTNEVEFFGDDNKKLDDIYVVWTQVAAVVPIEKQETQGSQSISSFR
jgi:hypothetical protein